MLRTVSNGQSIHQYIPPDLRRMFYKNPSYVHAIHNGLDPYGFSTNGLVLYLPLWALKNNVGFNSVDAFKHTCTNYQSLWKPNGRDFDGQDDYIELVAESVLDFTTGDFSIIIRFKVDDLASARSLIVRGLVNTDGWRWEIDTLGRATFYTYQSGAGQVSYNHTETFATGTWYTAGMTREGTSIKIFRNGIDITEVAGSHTSPTTSARTAKVGIYDNKTDNPFDGINQSVFAYSRALSAAEHLDVHNKLKWRT